ncbi:MAG: endonuclease/exonuclease/phosphatase family protein [Prevotella sp.]|nr:endonuclease/exonuclease/phosphatase family protein [Prevotella sp.]MDY4038925.1 endonuclease/exonuclease/phosphatase family protein [Prevotella sp.]
MLLSLLLASLFTFVELNCENLFDCEHDSLKEDTEYLPDSYHRWNHYKYWQKLNHIGQEIIACGGDSATWQLPDMVALCEVENDSVMRDLTKRSLLRRAGYEYVMTDGPDIRGIDVALLYHPMSFQLIRSHAVRVRPPKGMRPTRDLLYASGLLIDGDTLHVIVVHAPSRYGGERSTRAYRLAVADRIGATVDSIRHCDPHARILMAGDFNDSAQSAMLRAIIDHDMHDLSAEASGSHGARGTYRYHGQWERIDHVLCSSSMIAALRQCTIGDFPFLLEEDPKYGGVRPLRTFYGARYLNGYSDHLPLIARFSF